MVKNIYLQRISIIFALISSIEYDVYFRHIDLYIYCKIDLRDFCEVFAPKVPLMSQTCSFCLICKKRGKKFSTPLSMRREQDSNLRGNFVAYTLSRCVTVSCNYSDFQCFTKALKIICEIFANFHYFIDICSTTLYHPRTSVLLTAKSG